MAHALVPLKDLVTAKTRLSGLLRPAERRALAQAMVEDVLTTLVEHRQIERVTLVSDDPGAGLLACKYDIDGQSHFADSAVKYQAACDSTIRIYLTGFYYQYAQFFLPLLCQAGC